MISVLLISNAGDGITDYKDIEYGTTVNSLFESHIGGNTEDYLVRVNREQVSNNYVLEDGDRITFTPTKIEGA